MINALIGLSRFDIFIISRLNHWLCKTHHITVSGKIRYIQS